MFWASWWSYLEVEQQGWKQLVGGREGERSEGENNVFVSYLPLLKKNDVFLNSVPMNLCQKLPVLEGKAVQFTEE